MSLTLKQLRYFVAAANQGSVSKAAHALSISQSAVTEAIKELEAFLGVQLFLRHSRGMTVTPEGQQFLRHAISILAEVTNASRVVSAGSRRVTGRLNLGVTSLTAGYVLSDVLSRYRRLNPDVEVTAVEDTGEYLEHLIVGGELDVAVMVTTHLRDSQALQSEILEVSPFRLWLPIDHRLNRQQSIALSDVAGEPLIVLDVDEMEQEAVKLLSAFGERPRIAFRTRSVEAVRSLVATGAGVALLPDLVYRPWSLEGDRIHSRDVSGALPVVQVGLVWRRGLAIPDAAREFVAVAQAQHDVKAR
ncbi:LysR family transcriptional regulator [Lutimaribacter saemankumensis]|uniref:DNA-binding transcriptional regulator, LysR family n=1 Tax=Lutimaribacter saemankumensis TaxID=490829 RepID=A0A1G8RL75_9RHOB|nr:LysR family transcriptional regulator [Lutimaribacter saemankumensis]SDJ17662.1 DNA-binding transcriptional regulator, LysR family [Lutimaribacter saemankumensis]